MGIIILLKVTYRAPSLSARCAGLTAKQSCDPRETATAIQNILQFNVLIRAIDSNILQIGCEQISQNWRQ